MERSPVTSLQNEIEAPEGIFVEKNINESIQTMVSLAKDMGFRRGVAFMAVFPFDYFGGISKISFGVVDAIERGPDQRSANDTGTNYFGVAMSKLAEMMSTNKDSGSRARPLKTGELGYKGGIAIFTQRGPCIYSGFSGGTEDQDFQIALKGITTLIELAEKQG